MKNIFLFNKISAQNELNVNNLTVNQQLKLNGADLNELLITDSNSNVITFNNGSDRYLLEIDGTSHQPAWTNNILVDDITTNTMTINNTQADVLVIGDGIGSVERLPKGLNNQVLCVDASTFGLNYKYIYQLLNLSVGTVFSDNSGNIYSDRTSYGVGGIATFTNSTVLFSFNKSVVNGRNYKATLSWNSLQAIGGNITYTVNITGQSATTYVTFSQENIMIPFTANFTGTCTIQLVGARLPTSSNGTVNKVNIVVEPLGN